MRTVALIAALACAATAHAETSRESRYGPAPERAPTAMNGRAPGYTGAVYSGRALGWSGKREIAAPEAQAQAQQPWWARSAPQAPMPQQPQPAAYRPQAAAPAFAPQGPAAALPQSIYDAPAPAAPAAYAAPVQPQFQPGQVGARTYSVGREFGMTPDPIPAAGPSRMVMIAAPPASVPSDEDKARDEGNGEWSAKPEKDSDQ